MDYYLEDSNLEQYNTVIACFRLHVMQEDDQKELPLQFQVQEEDVGYFGIRWLGSKRKVKVLYRYNSTSFSPNHWQPVLTLVPIRNAIHAICAYQTSRAARKVSHGELLDPTNLVCEQLKHWLMSLASRDMSDGKAIQAEIGCYVNYLKTLEQHQVFPTSQTGLRRHERTMQSTLVEVSHLLNKASLEVGVMMNRRSLRDVMVHLRKSTTNAVDSMMQYLFYILRSHKVPAAIHTQDIQQGLRADLQEAKYTRSFKLLRLLVESPLVQAVNPQQFSERDGEFTLQQATFVFQEAPFLHIKKSKDGTPLLSSEAARQENVLNRAIGGNLIPDRHGLRRWWGNVHSGISGYFQSDDKTLSTFVKLHALVERMAHFSLICRDLEELVDFFGSKMWAEFGNQVLTNFQEGYRRLCNEIRSGIQEVHDMAERYHGRLIQQGTTRKPWIQNYNTADRLKTTLFHELDSATEQISHVPSIVATLQSPEKEVQIRQKLTGVVSALNQFGGFFRVTPIMWVDRPLSSSLPFLQGGNAVVQSRLDNQ